MLSKRPGKSVKFLAFIFVISMLTTGIPGFSTSNEILKGQGGTNFKVGDYIQFGHYYDDPILWRVINVNADGSYFLYSEKILCLKAFDASGDPTANSEDDFVVDTMASVQEDMRNCNGSSYWRLSNIREWLNSENEKVNYSCQPPDKAHVLDGINPYDKEAGFLSNFTKSERAEIQPVTHKSLLSYIDRSAASGGTEYHNVIYMPSDVVQNYDSAYYENVQDKVFLLDVKELHDYVYNHGWQTPRMCTQKALENSTYYDGILVNTNWDYWLRSPSGDSGFIVRCADMNEVRGNLGYNGMVGVIPALNLKADISISRGNGSVDKPFTLTGDTWQTPTITQTPTPMLMAKLAKPATPQNFTVSVKGATVKISWSSVKGATSYKLYYKKNRSSYISIAVTGTVKQLLGLERLQKYYFKVSAVNVVGESQATSEIIKNTGK